MVRRGMARGVGMDAICLAPLRRAHGLNANGALRACGDAGWMLSLGQSPVAHVAFAHNAAFGVVLRHAIGTVPGAVLAANADVRTMAHDSGGTILGVGIHRATRHASGFKTMVTA